MKKKRKNKYKSVITKRIFRALKKFSLAFVCLIFSLSVYGIRGTNSAFIDTEISNGNTFTAGSLDMAITSANLAADLDFQPGDEVSGSGVVENIGDTDFRYRAAFRKISGDNALCSALLLSAKKNGASAYSGSLSAFDLSAGTIDAGDHDSWVFDITLPAGASASLRELDCKFSFDFSAWQTDLPEGSGGFFDKETLEPNEIQVGTWAVEGDVIINEVMWMGSLLSTADEWIELRNTTDGPIDISGWKIEKAGTSGGTLTVPVGKTIPANGYFLIANYSNSNSAMDVDPDWVTTSVRFADIDNGNLVLKTSQDVVIDRAKGTTLWPAGWHGILHHMSMERNNAPGSGLNNGDWHTCVDSNCNDTTYWDDEGTNFGTPGAPNLSVNDPSAPEYDPAFIEQEYFDEQDATEEPVEPVEPIDQITSGATTEPTDEKKISKEVKVEFSGDPEVSDELVIKTEQKIKVVEISGKEEDVDKIEKITYDLAKTKIDSVGEIKIKISDLELPEGIIITNYKAGDVVFTITAEEVTMEKEVKIEFEGKLDLSERLSYGEKDIDQKIKKITVAGTEKELKDLGDKIIIDLSELDKIKEDGDFHFRVEDLDLPKGISIKDAEKKDIILEIDISKKEEVKKEETKKEEGQDPPKDNAVE